MVPRLLVGAIEVRPYVSSISHSLFILCFSVSGMLCSVIVVLPEYLFYMKQLQFGWLRAIQINSYAWINPVSRNPQTVVVMLTSKLNYPTLTPFST